MHDEAFNVGRTEENYRIREVAEIVGEVVPGSEVTFADGASPDIRNYRVNCDKIARDAAGVPAAVDGAQARVEELYEAYRAHGLELDDFLSRRFMRIKHVQRAAGRGRPRRRACAGALEATVV